VVWRALIWKTRATEFCALKTNSSSNGKLSPGKSRQLFNEKLSSSSPQIPQFRATFEQAQRLFLVQDYVEGKTYRTILDERKTTGKTFTSRGVAVVAAVVACLGSRSSYSPDITPDNIILQRVMLNRC